MRRRPGGHARWRSAAAIAIVASFGAVGGARAALTATHAHPAAAHAAPSGATPSSTAGAAAAGDAAAADAPDIDNWTGGAPVTIPDSDYPIPAGALFVAPGGNDGGAGTQDDPFATVAHALAASPANGTIVLRGGVYRESLGVVAKPITIQSYPHEQAWLSGAVVVNGWAPSGSVWVHSGWTAQFCQTCFDPGAILPAFPNAGLPDMVFVDGRPLTQVTSVAAVGRGSFYADYANQALYVGDDPTTPGTIVEGATQSVALQFNAAAAGSVVRGVGFEDYAPAWNSWPNPAMVVVNAAPNVAFARDAFTRSASRALTIYASGASVTDSAFVDNGMVGIHANLADHLDIERNLVVGSNSEHFASASGATVSTAGMKITSSQFATIRDNTVEDNFANGIWLDISCYAADIVDNLVRGNDQSGIDIEISGSSVVASNVVVGNGQSGIRLAGATDTLVYSNTVADNSTYQISVHDDGRRNTDARLVALGVTWFTARNVLDDNILAAPPGGSVGPLLFTQDLDRPTVNDASSMITALDGNVYTRADAASPPALALWTHRSPTKASTFTSLAQLSSATGYESSGIELTGSAASQLFRDDAGGDYGLTPNGPASGTGLPLPSDVAALIGAGSGPSLDRGALSSPATSPAATGVSVVATNSVVLPAAATVTVQVAPSGAGMLVPTGVVTLADQATGDVLGSALLDATGAATVTLPSLLAGAHTIVATYAGDAYYGASSNSAEQDVVAAPTTTTVDTDTAAPVFGQPVALHAQVTGAVAPTGIVTFTDADGSIGSAAVDSTGAATITVTTLAVGSHTVDASYGGDGATAPSTDTSPATVVVARASSAVGVTATPPVPQAGKDVTLTAHAAAISPGNGVPSGTVTFYDGDDEIGQGDLDTSGATSVVLTASGIGAHDVTAQYAGDDDFGASTSTALTLTAVAGLSNTTLTSSTAAAVSGETVTFTAGVTDDAGAVADGSVTFIDTPTGTVLGAVGLDANGNASVSVSTLEVGDHTVAADYSGGATDSSSNAPPLDLSVARAGAAVGATVTPASTTAGSAVHVHATVSVAAPGSGTPTGSIHVTDTASGAALGDATLDDTGAADIDVDAGAVGARSLSIGYSGDTDIAPGTATAVYSVAPVPTTTAVSVDDDSPEYGSTVAMSAHVAGGAITPTGAVRFLDGTNVLGIATLDASGVATLRVSTLAIGPHAIVATYAGDASDLASDSSATPLIVTVAPAVTTTTLRADDTDVAFGQLVTFTAQVSGVAPQGTVTLFDGATAIGTPQTLSVSGTAVFAVSALAVGTHELVASYAGDSSNAPSDSSPAPLAIEVDRAATTTSLVATPTGPTVGRAVTLTATVAIPPPGQGVGTGAVTFAAHGVALGAPVALGTGAQASLTTSTLPAGAQSLTAQYSGDANAAPSTSAPVAITVAKRAAAITIASSAKASVAGQPVTFTASVSDAAGPVVDGSVLFRSVVGGVTTSLATVPVDSTGHAAYTTASLAVGATSVNARYLGGANDSAVGPAAVTQSVARSTTAVTVVPSSTTSTVSAPLTLQASVVVRSPGQGVPTGGVTFTADGVVLGPAVALDTSAQAALTITTLAPGVHHVSAKYAGDGATQASVSTAVTITIVKRTPVVTATSSAAPSLYGQTVTFTASVSDTGGAVTAGSVVWRDVFAGTTTTLGTGALDATGTAHITVTYRNVGSHSVTTSYSGAANDTAVTAPLFAQVVAHGVAAVAIGVTPLSVAPGGTATVTVHASAVAPATGTPAGAFTVYDGATAVFTGALDATASATATFHPLTNAGSHSITVTTAGNAAFAPATSAPVAIAVGSLSATQVALALTPASSRHGTPIVLSATVNLAAGATNRGARTGSVTFTVDGVVQPPVAFVTNVAKLTLTSPAKGTGVGKHTVTAKYSGDTHYGASTAAAKTYTVTS